eukprot:jgi/Psemu1/32074/gm1.32074_g
MAPISFPFPFPFTVRFPSVGFLRFHFGRIYAEARLLIQPGRVQFQPASWGETTATATIPLQPESETETDFEPAETPTTFEALDDNDPIFDATDTDPDLWPQDTNEDEDTNEDDSEEDDDDETEENPHVVTTRSGRVVRDPSNSQCSQHINYGDLTGYAACLTDTEISGNRSDEGDDKNREDSILESSLTSDEVLMEHSGIALVGAIGGVRKLVSWFRNSEDTNYDGREIAQQGTENAVDVIEAAESSTNAVQSSTIALQSSTQVLQTSSTNMIQSTTVFQPSISSVSTGASSTTASSSVVTSSASSTVGLALAILSATAVVAASTFTALNNGKVDQPNPTVPPSYECRENPKTNSFIIKLSFLNDVDSRAQELAEKSPTDQWNVFGNEIKNFYNAVSKNCSETHMRRMENCTVLDWTVGKANDTGIHTLWNTTLTCENKCPVSDPLFGVESDFGVDSDDPITRMLKGFDPRNMEQLPYVGTRQFIVEDRSIIKFRAKWFSEHVTNYFESPNATSDVASQWLPDIPGATPSEFQIETLEIFMAAKGNVTESEIALALLKTVVKTLDLSENSRRFLRTAILGTGGYYTPAGAGGLIFKHPPSSLQIRLAATRMENSCDPSNTSWFTANLEISGPPSMEREIAAQMEQND